MAKRKGSISGLSIALATAGVWMVYSAVFDVPFVDGLRGVLQGRKPESRQDGNKDDARVRPSKLIGQQQLMTSSSSVASSDSGDWRYRLHPELARRVGAMIAASNGRVIANPGSGWRSNERQAELRRINGCPDIYKSPASACRVPTARPGQSKHNKVPALAIDLDYSGNGESWALMMAPKFGLEMPIKGEPWHVEMR